MNLDDSLIRRVLDGQLSSEEFASFDRRLAEDADFRRRYIQLADSEALFRHQGMSLAGTTAGSVKQSVSQQWVVSLCVVTMSLVMVFAAALLLQNSSESEEQKPLGIAKTSSPTSPISVASLAKASAANLEDAAVVTRVSSRNSTLKVGDRIKRGRIELTEGTLQLEFMCGTQLLLAGPAELFVESEMAATLLRGRAAAEVPERARGFVLNSPTAAVYDLGTAFGIDVNESGESEVVVHSGEVQLSLLGDDGNTVVSRLVGEQQAFKASAGDKLIELEGRTWSDEFQVQPLQLASLKVPIEYVSEVFESEATSYWRFEGSDVAEVSNEVSGGASLKVFHPQNGVSFVDGSVFLKRSGKNRYLMAPVGRINSQNFSVELWLNPSDLPHSTCLGVFPSADTGAQNHLSVVEIATDSFMRHDPGALRFLYRSPPGYRLDTGQNIFSSGSMAPGLWHHVVVVRSDKAMEMYLNGKLIRRLNLDAPRDSGDHQLLLGQLRTVPHQINGPPKRTIMERQFSGAIDEVAVYSRALSPADIQTHYRLIAEANQRVSQLP